MNHSQNRWFAGIAITLCLLAKFHLSAEIGVGAKPASGSDVLFDGSRTSLDEKWTYWEGPRFASSPIKWKISKDPVDAGNAMITLRPGSRRRRLRGRRYCHEKDLPRLSTSR